jgi:hypothetical protein
MLILIIFFFILRRKYIYILKRTKKIFERTYFQNIKSKPIMGDVFLGLLYARLHFFFFTCYSKIQDIRYTTFLKFNVWGFIRYLPLRCLVLVALHFFFLCEKNLYKSRDKHIPTFDI